MERPSFQDVWKKKIWFSVQFVITCMKQFNGRYGCQLCLQEGDPLANAPMVCCWPPEPSMVLRTNEIIIADAEKAFKLGEDVSFS